jgi:glycosyltransferase involved in cell wall biosynthesis
MFFSVVIPLFNKEAYVLRAIQSVLNQTHSDFELIVVDDGSTDGGAAVVESVIDPRVRLIRQPNGGVSKARNRGVQEARADWVSFLDADDEYEPEFLKRIFEFIRDHADADLALVGTNHYFGDRSNVALQKPKEDGVYDYFELFGNQRSPNNSSATVVNKAGFLAVGGFPEGIKYFEDWTTWFKLALAGDFGFISSPLGIYHEVAGSVARSKRNSAVFFHDAAFLIRTVREQAGKCSVSMNRQKLITRRMNEFAVNTACLLAHDGAKNLAIQMCLFICLKQFSCKRAGHLGRLVLHLAVPQQFKLIYWRYKSRG